MGVVKYEKKLHFTSIWDRAAIVSAILERVLITTLI